MGTIHEMPSSLDRDNPRRLNKDEEQLIASFRLPPRAENKLRRVWEESRPIHSSENVGDYYNIFLAILFFLGLASNWKPLIVCALIAYVVDMIIVIIGLGLLDIQLARRMMPPWNPSAMKVWRRQSCIDWRWWLEKIAFFSVGTCMLVMGYLSAGIIVLIFMSTIIYFQSEIYQQVQEAIEKIA